MRQVQATDAGEQQIAPHRGHGVEQVHLEAGRTQDLGRHEPRRPSADDGHRAVQGGMGGYADRHRVDRPAGRGRGQRALRSRAD